MNYVSLLGRFTRDPEVTWTQSGKAYVRFSLAVQRDSNRDEADFINCVAWDKRAETIGQYFKKGSRILIQGRLNVSSYEKNGETRYSTDVVVNGFNFIDRSENSDYSDRPAPSTESRRPAPREEVIIEDEDDFPF
ncbi:single-stranded DNA-binding protein [Pseudostreptobacillus hongkongensis]|uniref:single-stranded DNA-binding protein n=1 Tax=Pseudostreptobacillus hongkongensis TaxID=1162717 RepID=UPI000832E949|nr:single-stranded DNA-binding protein [Pseudostreptobacillus hongkongensis]